MFYMRVASQACFMPFSFQGYREPDSPVIAHSELGSLKFYYTSEAPGDQIKMQILDPQVWGGV